MIFKIQNLKSKTKLKFNKELSVYYNEMNYLRQSRRFYFEEDLSVKIAQSIVMIVREAL